MCSWGPSAPSPGHPLASFVNLSRMYFKSSSPFLATKLLIPGKGAQGRRDHEIFKDICIVFSSAFSETVWVAAHTPYLG